jgi:hypothetical protein
MKYLFAVAVLAGGFEALSALWFNAPDVAGQVAAGVFAILLLACAWLMRSRRSLVAATVIGLLLLVDVAGVPFYTKSSWSDWVIQLAFGALGAVGVVAWINVLRDRRNSLAAEVR